MSFTHVLRTLPPEDALALRSRPYFNHAVELKKTFTAAERAQMLQAVGLNVFYFPAEMVTGCDLLSDSGDDWRRPSRRCHGWHRRPWEARWRVFQAAERPQSLPLFCTDVGHS